jgi:hypothetical protein
MQLEKNSRAGILARDEINSVIKTVEDELLNKIQVDLYDDQLNF